MSNSPPRASSPTIGRILRAVGLCLLLLHAAQTFAGDAPLAAVIAAAIGGGYLAGWRLDVLRSVRTAVVLLMLLSVACVLGTLTVQRSQIGARSEGEYVETLSFAWAHLLVKATHPLPRGAALPDAQATHLERLAAVFGDDVAAEERDKLVKSLAAHRDETAARELAQSHPGPFTVAYRVADSLRLTDLFAAWWFHGLFYLLSACLVLGAVLRRRPSLRNVGFHGAHLGLVLVVLGSLVGAFTGQRGSLPLTVGESSSSFITHRPTASNPLGFALQLDRFDTLYHEDLFIEAIGAADPHAAMGMGSTAALRRDVELEQGTEVALTDVATGRSWTLTLAEIAAAASVRREYVPAAAEPAGEGALAAVELDAFAAGAELGLDGPFWLTTDDGLYVDARNRFKLRVEEGGERPGAERPDGGASDRAELLSCEPGVGTLTLIDGDDEPRSVRVHAGEPFTLGRFAGSFGEVTPDFRVGDEPAPPDAFPRNPALWLTLREAGEADEADEADGAAGEGDPGDGAPPLLLFSDPRLKGFADVPFDGVDLSFDYDYWCAPAGAWIRLWITGDGSAAVLRVDGEDGGATRTAIADGAELSIAGLDEPVVVRRILAAASERTSLVPAGDGEDDGPARTALRLSIDGPDGASERWLLSNGADGAMWLGGEPEQRAGSGFAILLADNRQRPPRDWKAHLTFLEDGVEVGHQVIEVNAPAHHGGYTFFQSDADADRPDYSGLQVVRDPGWPLVAGGLWLLLLGIPWCFYVQPLFDRRRRG